MHEKAVPSKHFVMWYTTALGSKSDHSRCTGNQSLKVHFEVLYAD